MARCYFTWRGTKSWNNRSHSMRRTNRTFKVNLIKKRVQLPDWSKVSVLINSRDYKKMRGLI